MCGIAGLLDPKGSAVADENRRIVQAMCDSIRHRGPDGHGYWDDSEHGVFLGHRRLSIIDLSDAGKQPMASDDGRVVITYNGEIYHFAELREELIRLGREFKGHSDSEVIANGIAQWGVEGLTRRIGGMFAIAAWLPETGELFLIRDRLGKKPLYWTFTDRGLAFASELSALGLVPGFNCERDDEAATSFLRTGHVPEPLSIYKAVKKVSAGEILRFVAGDNQPRSLIYWSVQDAIRSAQQQPEINSLATAVEMAEQRLEDAVTQRMIADVPYGAFLSGGIDSSLVVALMQKNASRPVRTFSIGYENSSLDESEDAAAVAKHLGTEHMTFVLRPDDAIATIHRLPEIYSEPFADPSQIPTAIISKLAKEHVTVVLTGDGGDEVFGGYNRHVAAMGLIARIDRLPQAAKTSLAAIMRSLSPAHWDSLFNLVPGSMRPRQPGEKLHKLSAILGLDSTDRYRQFTSQWDAFDDVSTGSEPAPVPPLAQGLALLNDDAERLRYLDLLTYLPGDVLTKVDRATMAYGLEARAPLLDYRLVELSWQIPSQIHIQRGSGKQVLRSILEKYVPRPMFERPKSGFGVPIGNWLRGPLRDWAEPMLTPAALSNLGLVRPEKIAALWQSHVSGRTNAQYALWNILMLQAWVSANQIHARLNKAA